MPIHGKNRPTLILRAVLTVLLAAMIALGARAANAADVPPSAPPASHPGLQKAVFSGGCFWGVDGVFKHVRGVTNVVSGYSGGTLPNPTYELVSTGMTGYAESVEVTYDPSKVSYDQLLKVFFLVAHDPTELNRQGPDEGTQYRSAIFYMNEAQKRAALNYIARLNQSKQFSEPIVTQVVAFHHFYPAEDYHQNFLERNPDNPYIVANDLPKIDHLRNECPDLYKQ
jgi:peptide-methionine (S)-S-oxide reductase